MFFAEIIRLFLETMIPQPALTDQSLLGPVPANGDELYLLRTQPEIQDFQGCIKSDELIFERVVLEIDGDERGLIQEVRVIDATNLCYTVAAINAANVWRMAPLKDGEALEDRRGVRTTIEFQVGGD